MTNTKRSQGRLFISDEKMPEFLQSHSQEITKGDKKIRSFKVTNSFVYGEANKDGKDRFLVFHNLKNKPYQVSHRSNLIPVEKY